MHTFNMCLHVDIHLCFINSYLVTTCLSAFNSAYTYIYILGISAYVGGLFIMLYMYSSGVWQIYLPWPWPLVLSFAMISKLSILASIINPVFNNHLEQLAYWLVIQANIVSIIVAYQFSIRVHLEYQVGVWIYLHLN